jgi:maltodextrin utilization protein YvdJ
MGKCWPIVAENINTICYWTPVGYVVVGAVIVLVLALLAMTLIWMTKRTKST